MGDKDVSNDLTLGISKEDIAVKSTIASIQNLLLAAYGIGLGAVRLIPCCTSYSGGIGN